MRVAEFIDGPLDGKRVPEDVVPWPLFVPRKPGDLGPPRNLSRNEVVRQSHYTLIGLTASAKIYRWIAAGTAYVPPRGEVVGVDGLMAPR